VGKSGTKRKGEKNTTIKPIGWTVTTDEPKGVMGFPTETETENQEKETCEGEKRET